jgi:NADH-quinone oxidoreductase subunit N
MLSNLTANLGADLLAFLPELVLCAGIVFLLVFRLFRVLNRVHLGVFALAVALLALGVSWQQWQEDTTRPEMFSGLLAYDKLTIFLRLFLYAFAALLIWLSLLTGIPDREDSADFYCLLLGATLGMALMASANHLLMVFIAVEMASLPSYALAGFLKGKRQSSEAALKYVVYGGGAAGIMLYGISLIAGKFGTGYLPDIATGFAAVFGNPPGTGAVTVDTTLVLGILFILVGFGFKLAAFPFHFWCPDVFEGAAAEVAGFLSVASKGAALALTGRFALVLAGLAQAAPDLETWQKVSPYLGGALAVFAALTATFGNLAAYQQTNLKRLLAYSTIAHAGYMMMGLATLTPQGVSAVLFYLVAYLLMNLGAFAIVAFLRNLTGSEDLSTFRGLIQRSPLMVVTLGFFLLSLLGLPPLVGFAAKFQIFRVLFEAGNLYREQSRALSYTMYALLVIGGLNTVFSVFYYLKVLKVMALDKPLEEIEGRPAVPLAGPLGFRLYATLLAAVVLVLGIFWDPLARASDRGVDRFGQVMSPAARDEVARRSSEQYRSAAAAKGAKMGAMMKDAFKGKTGKGPGAGKGKGKAKGKGP